MELQQKAGVVELDVVHNGDKHQQPPYTWEGAAYALASTAAVAWPVRRRPRARPRRVSMPAEELRQGLSMGESSLESTMILARV
jgi:hypothetical protein